MNALIRSASSAAVLGFIGWLVADDLGALVGVAAGVAVMALPRVVIAAAASSPIVLAASSLVEAPLDSDRIRVFASDRPDSHTLGSLMIVVWLAAAVVVWRRATPDD